MHHELVPKVTAERAGLTATNVVAPRGAGLTEIPRLLMFRFPCREKGATEVEDELFDESQGQRLII